MAAFAPFGMTGIPGANPGGSNMAVPNTGASSTPAIGSAGNTSLLPQFPGGTNVPGMTDSTNLANLNINALLGNQPTTPNNPLVSSGGSLGGGGGVPGWLAAISPIAGLASLFGGGGAKNPGQVNEQGNWVPNQKDFIKAFQKAGYSAGDAAMLFNFLQSGAGFNPQVAQALVAAMQPGIERGQADILEQFSAQGLRSGSPAAVGLADYLGQVQLNEGQIWAGLYEQSVQNYMNVLMGGKRGQPIGSTFDNILKFMDTSSKAALAGATAAG